MTTVQPGPRNLKAALHEHQLHITPAPFHYNVETKEKSTIPRFYLWHTQTRIIADSSTEEEVWSHLQGLEATLQSQEPLTK